MQDTQTLLWQLITAPENVHDIDLPVTGSETLSPADRLNIYANMYFFRILDCLKDDFPSLVRILGDDGFHNLITDYLQAHPPTHYSLRYAGEHMAAFLGCHPEGEARRISNEIRSAARNDNAWAHNHVLADLARLEWALITAFDAADATSLSAADLHAIPPEQWGELKLALHPSCQLLTFEWDALSAYEKILEGSREVVGAQTPTHVRIWRQDLQVMHVSMTATEMQFLEMIAGGKTLSVILSEAKDLNSAEFTHFLQTWIAQDLLCH